MNKRDAKRQLQTAYYDLLTAGLSVPVYDSKPPSPEYPHVGIGEWTAVDGSDKSSHGDELTLTLTVVDQFQGTQYSRAPMYEVTAEILSIICARPAPFDLDGFNVITSTLDSQTTFRGENSGKMELWTAIRFRHIIEQTT